MDKLLVSEFPTIASEWNIQKNVGIDLAQIKPRSNKKVWWRCSNNPLHEWQTAVAHRTAGTGCPFCSGKRALAGDNDFSTTHPQLATEWHKTKNVLNPEHLTAGSKKRVWWQCQDNPLHEWEASVEKRVGGKTKCPYCLNQKVLAGDNDLATTNPDLATEWHSEKNTLRATEVTAGSNKKVWWRCRKNPLHEWQSPVSRRNKGSNCPVCSGHAVQGGANDLATTHPLLAREWHKTKNTKQVTEVSAGSNYKIWWQCLIDPAHEWQAEVSSRTAGKGCPICTGRVTQQGVNDLATTHPALALLWDHTKNMQTPDQVHAGSHKRAYWRCAQGHEFESVILQVAKALEPCPYCGNREVLSGFNDLASTHPLIAQEWSDENTVSADQVLAGTDKAFIWQCRKNPGHIWEAAVNTRSFGQTSCPICANRIVIAGDNDLATTHPHIAAEWDRTHNDITPEQVTFGSAAFVWWKCPKGHRWQSYVYNRVRSSCPSCSANNYQSQGEKEVLAFIKTILPNTTILQNTKQFKAKGIGELDIYIPGAQIAIEYNGVYWHSELYKDKTYHLDKYLACKKLGIQLIQIWEDDWVANSSVVKNMLAHKLSANNKARVYARKTTFSLIGKTEADKLMELNHIQGPASGSIYAGLKDEQGKLVAAAVFKKHPAQTYQLDLVRYATQAHVIGGLGKIIKGVRREKPGLTSIVTFADHCVSSGAIYTHLGFAEEAQLRPDYSYLINSTREHKFNYRLRRFKDDPNLVYVDGKTERELATLNNMVRIYDAGKTRYRLTF